MVFTNYQEGVMSRKIIILLVLCLSGCISFKNSKVTTLSDYMPGGNDHGVAEQEKSDSTLNTNKETSKQAECPTKKNDDCHDDKNTKTNSAHAVTLGRSWGFITNKFKEKTSADRYFGISFTITNPNKFFRFKVLTMMTNTQVVENEILLNSSSYSLNSQSPNLYVVDVETVRKKTVFVILPILSAPLVRYDFDLRLGPILNVDANLELRTGIGYEWRINYMHSETDINVLGAELNNVYLPSDISNDSYVTQTTTIDLNFEPLHFEANYIVNRYEMMFYLSLGGIW